MNRFLKALSLTAIFAFAASCNKDDSTSAPPPRDYGVQYNGTDKALIETFLKTHYVLLDPETLDATFPEKTADITEPAIWDHPLLKSKIVKRDDVDYTLYYLMFREGVGDKPTMADNINFTFRGTLLNGTQFDYRENVSTEVPLSGLVPGWWDVLNEFGAGIYQNTNPGDPASFTDYGAGAMFLPSGLAFFNGVRPLVSAYSCTVFTFQLMDVTYTDVDGDGILNKYEVKAGINPDTNRPYTVEETDTDGDDIPDYLDTDDDGDGRTTKEELRKPVDPDNPNVVSYYTYEDMYPDGVFDAVTFSCSGTGTVPKYLDNSCKGGRE